MLRPEAVYSRECLQEAALPHIAKGFKFGNFQFVRLPMRFHFSCDAIEVTRQRTAFPKRSDDFLFIDGSQKFGFGVLIETRPKPSGRSAGSYGWAGILNTYYWIDPVADIAAVVMMQLSPFSAPVCLDICDRFERAVYHELVAAEKSADRRR